MIYENLIIYKKVDKKTILLQKRLLKALFFVNFKFFPWKNLINLRKENVLLWNMYRAENFSY